MLRSASTTRGDHERNRAMGMEGKHDKAFHTMKKIISREILLAYPDFLRPIKIHTDTSDYQLRAVINQNNKTIVFYGSKLNMVQTRYTTTEKELIAIVKTLKEFKNILLWQDIKVYIDHKNLMYKTHKSARVMCWRLTIEEFGSELIYIPGNKNIVTDALSCLPLEESTKKNK